MGVLRGAGGSSGCPEKWSKTVVEANRKSHSRGGDRAANRGRGFGCLSETLVDSIKTKLELGFIVDIASFQLAQKSSNFVMFWLSKHALKFH